MSNVLIMHICEYCKEPFFKLHSAGRITNYCSDYCRNINIKGYKKQSYIKNRDKILKYHKDYAVKNKQKIKKYRQKYQIKNKDKSAKYKKEWMMGQLNDNTIHIISRRKVFTCKRKSKVLNIPFDLTFAYMFNLIKNVTNCEMCNVKLTYYNDKVNGIQIDRYEPNRGYVKNNIVILCASCNRRKGDMTFKMFETMYLQFKELEEKRNGN